MKLSPYETIDDLQRDGLKIIQNDRWFKFGIDAVLLSYFCQPKSPKHIVDLGTGTGIIPLLLSNSYPKAHLTGLEIQPDVADMAKRSVALNKLEARIDIISGDIKKWSDHLRKGCADTIVANPPYFKVGSGVKNFSDYKWLSRHEVACNLQDLFTAAQGLLMPGGAFYLIHRPSRLADIIEIARAVHLEPKIMQFVQPKSNQAPNLILIKCVKHGGFELKLHAPIIVYDDQNNYTKMIYSIYNQAKLTVFSD